MNALTITLITTCFGLIAFFLIYLHNKQAVKEWLASPEGDGKFYKINDRSIYATIKGHAGTPVLIIPDLGAPASEWWPLQDKLSRFTKVITFDRPGYGWSENSMRPRKCKEIISEMNELLHKAEIEEPIILLGHAQGALYAQFFARLYPKQVAGVILVDPMIENMKWQSSISDKIYNQFFDTSRKIRRYRKLAKLGWLRMIKKIKKTHNKKILENILNHYGNIEMYAVAEEEYNFAIDQGCLAVKIAPPFPEVPLNVIYHQSSKKIEKMKKSGLKAEEAEQAENTWQTMTREYLQLSPFSNWTEAINASENIHLEEEDLIVKAIQRTISEVQAMQKNQLLVAAGA